MAQIQVLDKHTAELIAAGEVVERPASVVKELAENAIDAGATSVSVSIEHGGVSCIQIADNGSGIEAEYIPTAFIRHATSKIRTQDDLEHIATLGFRGEALASVASVARVELLTRTEADEFACLYRISGGVEEGLEAAARPVGTTITVRDLFYNTPARMKFLKKDVSEANYVGDVVTQLALSHPEVSFKLVREGKPQFQTPGDGKLRGAVYAVLSREFAQDLLDVDSETNGLRVSGCVTPPRGGRASRGMQYFFVNGRFVKNRTMMAALEAACKGLLMQGKYPGCVLFLEMPPHLVDVNVHPAKTEVRFAREKDVFDAVYQAVKGALMTQQATERVFSFAAEKPQGADAQSAAQAEQAPPQLPNASAELPQGAAAQPMQPVQPREVQRYGGLGIAPQPQQINAYNGMVRQLAGDVTVPYSTQEPAQACDTAEETCGARGVHTESAPAVEGQQPSDAPQQTQLESASVLPQAPQTDALQLVGEVFHTYIVAQRGEEICFIDKHAAHERILYEELAARRGSVDSQLLLCPVTVQLSAEEKNAVLEHCALLGESGVEVEDFGAGAVVVRSVPADMDAPDVTDLVVELASRLAENPRQATSEKLEWVLHSIACRAAVKAGDKTHPVQLLRLAQDILDGAVPPFCPHGRPAVLKVTKKELEKQFGRLG